jgi:FixJ family two-component response regulator
MLKDVGYTVEDYSSALTFLEHSVPVAPAVILLDMQMPDMTGLDLQEKLVQEISTYHTTHTKSGQPHINLVSICSVTATIL